MVQLDIVEVSGVVYKVNSTGPNTEQCGTPYESVTIWQRVFIFLDWCLCFK